MWRFCAWFVLPFLHGPLPAARVRPLVAVMSLFQERFGGAVLGSSAPYDDLFLPWGSNPISDPLLSSDRFRVVHDGASHVRVGKIEAIADWPEARANLRVCWEGEDAGRNCGRCEKCIRTILGFRVVGAGVPACFPGDVSDTDISRLAPLKDETVDEFEEILDAARARGIDDSWVRRLRRVVRRSRARARVRAIPLITRMYRSVQRLLERVRPDTNAPS